MAMLFKFPTRRGLWLGWLIGVGLLVSGLAVPASANDEDVGDAVAGHRLAEVWCTNCHIIDRTTKTGSSTGAPPFAAVAQMKSVTPMSLRVFLQSPHQRMPDLHLSRPEMDDLISYIMSLREK